MPLYHFQIGFPKTLKLPSGVLKLRYSYHAKDQAEDDRYGRISLPATINLDLAKLIEVEVDSAGAIVKFVARAPYDGARDIVVVAQPDGFVRTVWFNHWEDKHRTLDRSKYEKP